MLYYKENPVKGLHFILNSRVYAMGWRISHGGFNSVGGLGCAGAVTAGACVLCAAGTYQTGSGLHGSPLLSILMYQFVFWNHVE